MCVEFVVPAYEFPDTIYIDTIYIYIYIYIYIHKYIYIYMI